MKTKKNTIKGVKAWAILTSGGEIPEGDNSGWSGSETWNEDSTFTEKGKCTSRNKPTGRFPANILHDNSEEVRECFPETKSGKIKPYTEKPINPSSFNFEGREKPAFDYADNGNASRFFKSISKEEQDEIQEECTSMEEKLEKLGLVNPKSIIYQAKASKSERNKGCEGLYTLKDNTPKEDINEIKHLLSI